MALKKYIQENMDELKNFNFWRAVGAEFVGTLILVFVVCGSGYGVIKDTTQIALAAGLVVATVVWCIGHVSGGHINPAVTVGMLVARRISVVRTIWYIMAQSVGAIAGAAILYGVVPSSRRAELGITALSGAIGCGQGFGIEFIITFILVLTVFAATDSKRVDRGGSMALAIGLSVTACHLFAVPLTGASMNSARSFGPAVVVGKWKDHWVYWVGPIAGGVFAGLIYEYLFSVTSIEATKDAASSKKPSENGIEDQDGVMLTAINMDESAMSTSPIVIDEVVDEAKK